MTLKAKKILIVDDEKVLAVALGLMLSEQKAEILTAGSLKEAGAVLDKGPVDLVILDRTLPDGDGVELLIRLRKEPGLKKVPVLILSGKTRNDDQVDGLDLGADDYMTKPFSVPELRARVDTLLRRARKFKH